MSERTVKEISWHLPCRWWYLSADKIKAAVKGKSEPLSACTWAAQGAEQRLRSAMSAAVRRVWGEEPASPTYGGASPCSPGSTACGIGCWPCAGVLYLWERICVHSLSYQHPMNARLKRCFLPRIIWKCHPSFLRRICRLSRGCSLHLLRLQCSCSVHGFTSHGTKGVSFPCVFPGVK